MVNNLDFIFFYDNKVAPGFIFSISYHHFSVYDIHIYIVLFYSISFLHNSYGFYFIYLFFSDSDGRCLNECRLFFTLNKEDPGFKIKKMLFGGEINRDICTEYVLCDEVEIDNVTGDKNKNSKIIDSYSNDNNSNGRVNKSCDRKTKFKKNKFINKLRKNKSATVTPTITTTNTTTRSTTPSTTATAASSNTPIITDTTTVTTTPTYTTKTKTSKTLGRASRISPHHDDPSSVESLSLARFVCAQVKNKLQILSLFLSNRRIPSLYLTISISSTRTLSPTQTISLSLSHTRTLSLRLSPTLYPSLI